MTQEARRARSKKETEMQAPAGDNPRCLPRSRNGVVTGAETLQPSRTGNRARYKAIEDFRVTTPGYELPRMLIENRYSYKINRRFSQRIRTRRRAGDPTLGPLDRGWPNTICRDDSFPFQHRVELVGGKIGEGIDFARWPANLYPVDLGSRAQPEVQPQIVLR